MSEKADPQVSRRLKPRISYGRDRRRIVVTLAHGDLIKFELEGTKFAVSLPLMPLFWQALRDDPAARSKKLLPKVLKGRVPKRERPPGERAIAHTYGVSIGVARRWKKENAPVTNPDKMGDWVFRAKQAA